VEVSYKSYILCLARGCEIDAINHSLLFSPPFFVFPWAQLEAGARGELSYEQKGKRVQASEQIGNNGKELKNVPCFQRSEAEESCPQAALHTTHLEHQMRKMREAPVSTDTGRCHQLHCTRPATIMLDWGKKKRSSNASRWHFR